MRTLLVTNDDGIDSPTLLPLAAALAELGTVRVVVPHRERSWIGKAISRFDRVRVERTARAGVAMHAVHGTPADCVSLGVHALFEDPPDLVVSGINLGLNYGTAFVFSSGTVGAAFEAALAGVPSIAFSMAIPSDAYGLAGADRAALLGPRCEHAAATALAITCSVIARGFPAAVDVLSVNMPAEVTPATPRRLTRVTRARYGALFSPTADGTYQHRFRSYAPIEACPDGDIETVGGGMVSIAPMRLDLNTPVSDEVRRALEQPCARGDGPPDQS